MGKFSSISKSVIGNSITFFLLLIQMIISITTQDILMIAMSASILIFVGYSLFNARKASASIAKAINVMDLAASGQMDIRVLHIKGRGNISHMLRSINHILDMTEAFTKEAAAALDYASKGKYFRKIITTGMRGDFTVYAQKVNNGMTAMETTSQSFIANASKIGGEIKGVVSSVSSTAEELSCSAQSMGAIANQTSALSKTVAEAANDASANVEGVAAATEEFSASIQEVSEQIGRSAQKASEAVSKAAQTDATINTLNEAAGKIGEVVELINDIAAQTNLLALNATIEAARAGEAGKGFAVVANEVKNLANQTARATGEIVSQIDSMQNATTKAVGAIKDINSAINDIDETTAAIAAAVEEQSATVSEISSNAQQAVIQVSTVANSITQVSNGASEASAAVTQIQNAANELTVQGSKLNTDVSHFVNSVVAKA